MSTAEFVRWSDVQEAFGGAIDSGCMLSIGRYSPLALRHSVNLDTNRFIERHGEDFERKITPHWIGQIVRRKLGLRTEKRHGTYVIASSERQKLARLFEKYGIAASQEDFGDSGDFTMEDEGEPRAPQGLNIQAAAQGPRWAGFPAESPQSPPNTSTRIAGPLNLGDSVNSEGGTSTLCRVQTHTTCQAIGATTNGLVQPIPLLV